MADDAVGADGLKEDADAANEAAEAFDEAAEAADAFAEALGAAEQAGLNTRAALVQAGGAARDAQGSFIATGDSASQASEGSASLGEALGTVAEGAVAVVGAIVAVTAVVVALSAAAVDVNEKLNMMNARFAALAGSAQGGKQVTAMVQRLSQTLPFSTDQIAQWSQSLMAAGITGQELEKAVKAVAAATALMGESGGAAAESMLKKLAEGGKGAETMLKTIQQGGFNANKLLANMGLSTADVAKAMGMTPEQFAKAKISAEQMGHAIEKALQKKGAGPLDEMMNTFPVMLNKVKEGVLSLFDGLGPSVKPLMAAFKQLFGQFGKGGGVIKALKPIVTEVFGAIFRYATMAVTAISHFISNGTKGGKVASTWTMVKAAIHSVIATVQSLWASFKSNSTVQSVYLLASAFFRSQFFINGMRTALKAVAVVIGIVVAAFVGITVAATAVWAAMSAIGLAIWSVVGQIISFIGGLVDGTSSIVGTIRGVIQGAVATLQGLPGAALNAASNFVSGLAQGIMNGGAAVIAAVTGLASSAVGAFKSALGIASPSKVMLEHGEDNIAGATATGIGKGKGKVDKAMASLGGARPKGGAGARGGVGGGEVHYHYSGPVEHYPTFREHMQRFLEEFDASGPMPEAP